MFVLVGAAMSCHIFCFLIILYYYEKTLASGKKEEDNNTTQHATQNKIQLQQQPLKESNRDNRLATSYAAFETSSSVKWSEQARPCPMCMLQSSHSRTSKTTTEVDDLALAE